MLTASTFFDAIGFATAGLVLAVVMMAWRRETRRMLAAMLVTVFVGLVAYAVALNVTSLHPGPGLEVAVRELLLFLVAFGLVRITATFIFKGILARLAVPRIVTDLLMVLALIIYILVRINASGVNLGAIAVPSAVLTGALAFSLQATLGNLWGGIALQLDNTCRIGDWIRVENITGQIVSIRWRYLAVATNSNETVIIPNSKLVNGQVHVLGRRGDFRVPARRTVAFAVAFTVPPSRVIREVQDALAHSEIERVASDPMPVCVCTGFDDNGIQYGINYWLTDLTHDMRTDSEVRVHVYAALQRGGMEIPYPHRVLLRSQADTREVAQARELDARVTSLERVPLFAAFTPEERRALAAQLVTCHYVRGDVVSRIGDVADCLYILAEGNVGIYGQAGPQEARPKLAALAAPDYFGEMGLLTGQARGATILAEGDATCYRLDKPGFDAILRARPALIDALSDVVATRQAANDKTLATLSADARARQANTRATELVRRIRQFFDMAAK
jgi:small-conductance mechanosensitive channel/CRP-like cAMP-binding protein